MVESTNQDVEYSYYVNHTFREGVRIPRGILDYIVRIKV